MENFKVVFTGAVLPGFELAQVREAFATRFKMPPERVQRLFAGGEVVLRKELPHEQAYVLKSRLDAIGMHIRLDRLAPVFETSHLSLVDDPDLDKSEEEAAPASASRSDGATMSCPKCAHEQLRAVECRQCGIIIEKYLQMQATPPAPVPAARVAGARASGVRPSAVPDETGFRKASHKEALMGSWKVVAPIIGILLVGWKYVNRVLPDDYTLDDLRQEYEWACYEDRQCQQLLDSQWDGCVAASDFSRYEDAALSEKMNELDAFSARMDQCIVDENGEQMFYDAW